MSTPGTMTITELAAFSGRSLAAVRKAILQRWPHRGRDLVGSNLVPLAPPAVQLILADLKQVQNKYGVSAAPDRTIDGIRFDSKAEARRWQELKLMELSGAIRDLERQPVYVLIAPFVSRDGTKHRGIKYRGDFRYLEVATGRVICEDVKGARTEAYRVKKALLLWRYPDINFREVHLRG
ncbi:MAG: DUF1064 domain-containing protein [Clostridia bacterium]